MSPKWRIHLPGWETQEGGQPLTDIGPEFDLQVNSHANFHTGLPRRRSCLCNEMNRARRALALCFYQLHSSLFQLANFCSTFVQSRPCWLYQQKRGRYIASIPLHFATTYRFRIPDFLLLGRRAALISHAARAKVMPLLQANGGRAHKHLVLCPCLKELKKTFGPCRPVPLLIPFVQRPPGSAVDGMRSGLLGCCVF